jgi:6-phospho-beta-glucosidase
VTRKQLVVLGGSSLNTPALFAALAHYPRLALEEVCLVGRSDEQLEIVGRFCRRIVERLHLPTSVVWDTDLARAASGATYVLNVIRAGGVDGQVQDRRNLALSGIVGHAAGYAEALRNLPATLQSAGVLEVVAPTALLINFTNPVSALCEAVTEVSSLKCIGICHHAFAMRGDFATLLGVAPCRVRVEYFGLNHLGWVTDVLVDGHSQMRRLREVLVARRLKKYNYDVVDLFGLIPIKHASSLYRKGEVFYVREQGIRGSLVDAFSKPAGGLLATRLRRERHKISAAVTAGRLEVLDTLSARAPWYGQCILPFLDALDSGQPTEFILTWQHRGHVASLPGLTGESPTVVEHGLVRPVPCV